MRNIPQTNLYKNLEIKRFIIYHTRSDKIEWEKTISITKNIYKLKRI